MTVEAGLCRTWTEVTKTGFLHLGSFDKADYLCFRFDTEHSQDEKVHLDCFCTIAAAIEVGGYIFRR